MTSEAGLIWCQVYFEGTSVEASLVTSEAVDNACGTAIEPDTTLTAVARLSKPRISLYKASPRRNEAALADPATRDRAF